jgi:hypothetical protein
MTHEPNSPRSAESDAAFFRPPSSYVDTARPDRMNDRRAETRRQLILVSHVYDYFRYGENDATTDLEIYLQREDTGLHAEEVLDQLATLVSTGLVRLADPPGGSAA